MNKELNAAEAVYGFVGWLTSREERTVMSAKDDCAPIAELIKRFCTENNLPEVSDQWPLNLIHPSGEVAVPNAVLAKWGQPAQAGEYPELPDPTVHEDEVWRIEYFTESQMRAYVDADRAARAPADSVLEDAERYRWLREYAIGAYTSVFRGKSSAAVYLLTIVPAIDGIGEETDAAIDAARAAQKKP